MLPAGLTGDFSVAEQSWSKPAGGGYHRSREAGQEALRSSAKRVRGSGVQETSDILLGQD